MDSWLTSAICSRPALVFGQEFNKPNVLEPLAEEHGYHIVWPQRLETRWWIASWIMVRNDLTVTGPDDLTCYLLQPFSSYVAAAHVELPGIGATTMVSVHASPNPDAAWLQPDLDVAMVADHSPIWFNLDLRGVSGPAALE